MSATLILLIATSVVSIMLMEQPSRKYELMLAPYNVKHRGQWYRIFSHGFVHKDYMHLIFNMLVLYMFGYNERHGSAVGVEAQYMIDFGDMGIPYFLLLYVSAITFAALPALRKHGDNPNYLSLGASGAVSAVVFSYMVMYPDQELVIIFLPFLPLPAVVFGALYMGYEVYMDRRGGSGIAHDAHIWGAVYGIAFTLLIHPDNIQRFVDGLKRLF